MTKRAICIALLICSWSGIAGAGVVYNWENLTPSTGIPDASGQLVVAYDVWDSGSLDINYPDGGSSLCFWDGESEECSIPDSPVLFFVFDNGSHASPVYLRPRDGIGCYDCAILEMDLIFNADGTISGDMYANNSESDAQLSSGPDEFGIWTIDRFGSDNPDTGCFEYPQCSGGTGRWVLDPSSVAVPEPPAVAWLGLALVALAIAIRRRERASRG